MAGVQTQPVRGRYTPREAVDLMLARTVLLAIEDQKTGALLIKRGEAGKASGSPQSATPPPPPTSPAPSTDPKTMNPLSQIWTSARGLMLHLGILASASVYAQSTGVIEGTVSNVADGSNLSNAQVVLEGTNIGVLTDANGKYRVQGIAPGTATVRVRYTGFSQQSKAAQVTAGQSTQLDFALPLRESKEEGVVTMEKFTVVEREMSAQMAALNEQRNAPNIKNVVSSDEFSDVGDGNIGVFLRNMPGIDITYSGATPRAISIRGFPASGTLLTIDGGEVANTTTNGEGRHTEFDALKMNNIDRIEVTKVPTPDLPANAQGGAVNVISKSALGKKVPTFNYRIYGTLNSRSLVNSGLHSRPLPGAVERIYPIQPAFDFTFATPLNEKMALSIGGATSRPYTKQTATQVNWDLVNVVQNINQVQSTERLPRKANVSLGFDWRISKTDTLKLNLQYIDSTLATGDNFMNVNFGAGYTGGPTFTQGATPGVGSAIRNGYVLKWNEKTSHGSLAYRHDGPVWTWFGNATYSGTKSQWRDVDQGFFIRAALNITNLLIRGDGINTLLPTFPIPAQLRAVDRTGAEVDIFDGGSYSLGSVQSQQWDFTGIKKSIGLNAKRTFEMGVPVSLQTGGALNKQDRDLRRPLTTWTFRPTATAADRLARNYDIMDPEVSKVAQDFFPDRKIQWHSTKKIFDLYRQHPDWFVPSEAANHTSYVNTSKEFAETISAGYLRADARFFEKRLWVVAGARYERTDLEGVGPLNDIRATYRQDANGALILDAAGRPTRVTTDAIALAKLQYKERGVSAKRNYDGLYPSLNTTFSLTNDLLIRAAYAKTIGRPDLIYIMPGVNVADPTAVEASRTITVINSGLKPWESDAYDLSLEAYLVKDVVGSIGVFQKNLKNFFGSTRTPATPELLARYDLPDDYVGYDIVGTSNVGTAEITGFEFNYKHSLNFLPHWARGVQVFFNGVFLDLRGPDAAAFGAFSPKNLNWGINFIRPKFLFRLSWNQAARRRNALRAPSATIPAGTYDYRAPQTIVNANVEYTLNRKWGLFFTAQNLTDAGFSRKLYAPTTPAYARNWLDVYNGVDFTFGIKGQL